MATSNIQSDLKKYFYSGVGFAAHSSEIIKNAVGEFVTQGKLSEKDGQKIVGGAIDKIEAKYNEAAQKLGDYAASEIAMLRKKIEGLEKRVGGKNPTVAKAVSNVKKSVAGKPIVKKALKKAAAVKKTVQSAVSKGAKNPGKKAAKAPAKAAKKAVKKAAK